MKKIVFCNSLISFKKYFSKCDNKGKYLLFNWDKQSFDIKKCLDDQYGFSEVNIKDYRLWKEAYLGKITEMIADVNIANNKKPFWWALNFTIKNPITTPLCDKTFYALLIAKVIEEIPEETSLFIIGKDNDIFQQLKIWFKRKDVEIIVTRSLRIQKDSLKDVIRKYTPLAVFFAAVRALVRKIQAGSIDINLQKEYAVVFSLLNHQSFQRDGSYYDTYFGKFVSYAVDKNISLINLLFINSPCYRKMAQKIRKVNPGFLLIPIECFLSVLDILKCLFISLKRYYLGISINGDYFIDNKSVNYLINAVIRRDFTASYFYDNMRFHYEIKSLVKRVKINRFYYPFENRSIEKLAILIFKRYRPQVRVIGYQHPSLSLRHTNFLLTKEEAKITPFPDKIMTMGEVTRNFMRTFGNFPDSILDNGCALRQKQYSGAPKSKRLLSHVLVILATNIEEYIKVILFLNKAFEEQTSYKIWIRPHPVFPLSEAIAITGRPQFPFYQANKETIEECFHWADVVLYVHSTVGVESLAWGIPLIYLNINNVINPDPLFNFDDFKWQADKPDDLPRIFEEINELPEDVFYEKQNKGIQYTKKYLFPVNDNALEKFLSV